MIQKLHKITVFSIEKEKKDEYTVIVESYKKMIGRYANIKGICLFNKKIALSQKKDATEAKKSYSEVLENNLGTYNIFLHERGKMLDSMEFSNIFNKFYDINFFIAGAFGFEEKFLNNADNVISLSKMTLSHKIAKVVLYEQIYRALSIVNSHPYHK